MQSHYFNNYRVTVYKNGISNSLNDRLFKTYKEAYQYAKTLPDNLRIDITAIAP